MAKDPKQKKKEAAKKKAAAEKKENAKRKKQGLPPKKKGKLKKLIALIIIGVLGFWAFLYSNKIDKKPWEWGGDEWKGFATFSVEKAEDTAETAVDEIKQLDWDKLKEKVKGVEDKLEKKMAKFEERRKAERKAKGGSDALPGDVADADKTTYEEAVETMHKGVQEMKAAKRDKKKLKKAAKTLREANDLFEKANGEAIQAGDDERVKEIESWQQDCATLLQDCSKLAE